MKSQKQFQALIPYTLRSIPYILQSHVFKAYCALESLYVQKPHLPQSVWEYCIDLIQNDEPKVKGLIAPSLLEIQEISDSTSGRDFGPDWILGKGLMPLSYWAMHKKVLELGFPQVFQQYLEKALDHPIFLGHEISVLAGNWHFYTDIIASTSSSEDHALFLQRFTEFITCTFSHNNDTVFEHPQIDHVPTAKDIIREALENPNFFGHNILACMWAQRLKMLLSPEQYQKMLYNLTVLVRWHEFGDPPNLLQLRTENWNESDLDQALIAFFHNGPKNIHQITLAEVLVSIWNEYPEYRDWVATNLICFTQGTQPIASHEVNHEANHES